MLALLFPTTASLHFARRLSTPGQPSVVMAAAPESLEALEAAAMQALEREVLLDAQLGPGTGASKERARIAAAISAFEEAAAEPDDAEEGEDEEVTNAAE